MRSESEATSYFPIDIGMQCADHHTSSERCWQLTNVHQFKGHVKERTKADDKRKHTVLLKLELATGSMLAVCEHCCCDGVAGTGAPLLLLCTWSFADRHKDHSHVG